MAGQTAGPNLLKFFEGTYGYPMGNKVLKNFLNSYFSKIYFFQKSKSFLQTFFSNSTGNFRPFSFLFINVKINEEMKKHA